MGNGVVQKVEEVLGLTAFGAEMNFGNEQRAKPLLVGRVVVPATERAPAGGP
jgi:hypothetical protein